MKRSAKSDPSTDPVAADAAPDAWARFEAAMDKVVKAPPQHRTTKNIKDDEPRPERGRPSAPSGKTA